LTRRVPGDSVRVVATGLHHYMNVIWPGPLTIVRVPWPMPVWRTVIKALTPLAHAQHLRAKDVYSVEGTVPWPRDRDARDRTFVRRLDDAYRGWPGRDGKPMLPAFDLYDWIDGKFVLVRPGER
jgi:hypothetical protein